VFTKQMYSLLASLTCVKMTGSCDSLNRILV
jgi:hypothetical protein